MRGPEHKRLPQIGESHGQSLVEFLVWVGIIAGLAWWSLSSMGALWNEWACRSRLLERGRSALFHPEHSSNVQDLDDSIRVWGECGQAGLLEFQFRKLDAIRFKSE